VEQARRLILREHVLRVGIDLVFGKLCGQCHRDHSHDHHDRTRKAEGETENAFVDLHFITPLIGFEFARMTRQQT